MNTNIMIAKSVGRRRPWYGVIVSATNTAVKVLLIEPLHVEEGVPVVYNKQPAVKLPCGTAYVRGATIEHIKNLDKLLALAEQKGLI